MHHASSLSFRDIPALLKNISKLRNVYKTTEESLLWLPKFMCFLIRRLIVSNGSFNADCVVDKSANVVQDASSQKAVCTHVLH